MNRNILARLLTCATVFAAAMPLVVSTDSNGACPHGQICQAHDYVKFWKVGKLNHNKEVERSIDWPKFRDDATALLESFGNKCYSKDDLRNAV